MKRSALLLVSFVVMSTFLGGAPSKRIRPGWSKNTDYRGKTRVLLELGNLHQQLKRRKLEPQRRHVARLIDVLTMEVYRPALHKILQALEQIDTQARVDMQQNGTSKIKKKRVLDAVACCQRWITSENRRMNNMIEKKQTCDS